MKKINLILVTLIFFSLLISLEAKVKVFHKINPSPIISPTRIKSVFGEYRGNHFHSGIDLSTWQAVGVPVRAIDDGEIFMFSRLLYGYGNVLYLRHKNYISVYAHLDRFEEKYLKLESFSKRMAELYGDGRYILHYKLKNPIKVKKGQIIAYSGETGSGPPHLHFELRNKNWMPINPFNFVVVLDELKPEIKRVFVSPLKWYSKVDDKIKRIEIKENTIFHATGPFSIEALIWDRIDKYDKVGVYEIRAFIDDIEISHIRFDDFSFSEKREVGVTYDILSSSYLTDNFFYKIFPYFGSRMKKAEVVWERFFDVLSAGFHKLRIETGDFWGNKTFKEFGFIYDKRKKIVKSVKKISKTDFELKLEKTFTPDKLELYLRKELWSDYKKISFKKGVDRVVFSLNNRIEGINYYLKVKAKNYFQIVKFSPVSAEIDGFKIEKEKDFYILKAFKNIKIKTEKQIKKLKDGESIKISSFMLKVINSDGTVYSFDLRDFNEEEKILFSGFDVVVLSRNFSENSIDYGRFFVRKMFEEKKGYLFLSNDGNFIDLGDAYLSFKKNSLFYERYIKVYKGSVFKFHKDIFPVSSKIVLYPYGYVLKKDFKLGFRLKEHFPVEKLGIYIYKRLKKKWSYVGGKAYGKDFVLKTWRFGEYSMFSDFEKPEIKPLFPLSGKAYRRVRILRAKVSDKGKGVNYKKLFFYLDGRRFWAYYDPDKSLIYYPLNFKLKKGKHLLKIFAEDNAKNKSELSFSFFIK